MAIERRLETLLPLFLACRSIQKYSFVEVYEMLFLKFFNIMTLEIFVVGRSESSSLQNKLYLHSSQHSWNRHRRLWSTSWLL